MELPLRWSWISQIPKTSNKSVLLRYKHGWLQIHFWQVRKFEKGHLLLKAHRILNNGLKVAEMSTECS